MNFCKSSITSPLQTGVTVNREKYTFSNSTYIDTRGKRITNVLMNAESNWDGFYEF